MNPVKSSRLQLGGKLGVALTAFDSATDLYHKGREYWKNNYAYSVVVVSGDPLYDVVHEWLVRATPLEKHRAVVVRTSGRGNTNSPFESSDVVDEKPSPLKVQFNDRATRKMLIDGNVVSVSLKVQEATPENFMKEPEPNKIQFLARNEAGYIAVLEQLEKLNATRATTRKAVLKMVGNWGGWKTRSDLPPRTLDSVSLPEAQKARILADMEHFLGAEERYNRLAIPWHRGYMFYGPPGTGKTSIVKALAQHFNLDLWYVSLADLKAESGLLNLLSDVGPRSLLLLEDIDTMRITHDRDGAEQGQISMSSLLNTLDGVATPHGLMTVMTTNRFDILDPALTRSGRMDLVEEIDYPTLWTLKNLYEHFYGELQGITWGAWEHLDEPIEGLSTAAVAEAFKRNLDDPAAGASDLFELVNLARAKKTDG